jgi:hypothetical protein
MEVIGIQAILDRMELVRFIHSLFPLRELINWEGNFSKTFIYNGVCNREDTGDNSGFSGLAIQVESCISEFSTVMTLFRTEEKHHEERELFLALKISERFKCRTIINVPEGFADHPYSSLIVENGKIYEADDSGTVWGDGEGTEVKIIREADIKRYDFDKSGNCILSDSL